MKINKGLTREGFRNSFGSSNQCLQYLSDQTNCNYPTRIKDFYIDVPSDFDGEIRQQTHDGQTYILTGKSCEGPFHMKVFDPKGNVSAEYDYKRGELYEDKQMVEMQVAPYELKMVVDTAYQAIRVEK